MTTSKVSLVPLRLASLCLDCDMITPAQRRCMACGSAALMNLARTLSQTQIKPESRRDAPVLTHVATRRVGYGDFLHST
jgi:hypothetical protein